MTPEQTQALTAIAEARDALQSGSMAEALILLDAAAQSVWAIQTVGYSQVEMDDAVRGRMTYRARRKVKAYSAMLKQGFTLAEVAAKFNCTTSAIHNALRKAGLPTCSTKALAKLPRSTKGKTVPGNKRNFDRMEAYRLICQGYKLEMLSEHFGVTTAAIQQGLTRAGLPSSGKKYRAALEAGTLERDYPGTVVTA